LQRCHLIEIIEKCSTTTAAQKVQASALLAARIAFDRAGRIPLGIASRLFAIGICVHALEDQWARAAT
jgi:hypothetical protein